MALSVDMGGNDLRVNDIYYGASTPGSSGTKLDSTLLTTLQQPSTISMTVTGANFNASNGTDIATFTLPTLPTGYTRFVLNQCIISHASHTLATAVVEVFTGAGATGTALTASTALSGLTATADKTAANCAAIPPTSSTAPISCTIAGVPIVYLNLVTTEGAAATADVTLVLTLLP